MNAWKALLAAVVIFCAGVLSGGALVHAWVKPARAGEGWRTPPGAGRAMRGEYLHRLEKQLVLDAEQKAKIELILRESQERMRKLCDPISLSMDRETQATRERIQAVLNPEQLAKYREITKARFGRRGTGDGPPKEPPWDRRRNPAFGREGSMGLKGAPLARTNESGMGGAAGSSRE